MARLSSDERGAWPASSLEMEREVARPSFAVAALAIFATAYLALAFGRAGAFAMTSTYYSEPLIAPVFAAALLAIAFAAQIRWRTGLLLVLMASFVAQLSWASWYGLEPLVGQDELWSQSRAFADNLLAGDFDALLAGLHRSGAPSAVAAYGLGVVVFGDELGALRAISAGMWTLQTLLVWRIASEIAELRRAAFAAALVFGLSPTLIAFGALPSVEGFSGLLLLGGVWMVLSHRRRGLTLSVFLSGALLAVAFLAEPVAATMMFGVMVALLLGLVAARGWRARGRIFAAILAGVLGFAAAATPQALLNWRFDGAISIAPGPAIGEQLLFGLPDGAARLSEAGFDRVGVDGGPSLREADQAARRIAIDAILADPAGFFAYAVGPKLTELWRSEQAMLAWTAGSPALSPGDFEATAPGMYARPAVDGVYLAMLLAALLGFARLVLRGGAVRDPTRWILLLFGFLSLAAAHLVVEASARDNLTFAPLLALLAPFSVTRIAERARSRGPKRAVDGADAAVHAPAERAVDEDVDHDPRPMHERPVEERLALVLRRMSKPPERRDPGRGGDGPAAAA